MTEKYVVIAESKTEAALVHETFLYAADYETAQSRMRCFADDKNTIRVCMAQLVYAEGNKDLLK